VITKEDMTVEVRVVGTSSESDTQVTVTTGGSSTGQTVFEGGESDVQPTEVVYKEEVPANTPVTVGGHNENSGGTYSNGGGSPNVVVLVDGDPVPNIPAFEEGVLEGYLDPYVDDSGKIDIGPKDVIILYELETTDPAQPGFDLQDLVVLVSCKTKSNNGHGNNIDGIDSSNPGNAPFIPYDTIPEDPDNPETPLDDEGSGGGAYPSLK